MFSRTVLCLLSMVLLGSAIAPTPLLAHSNLVDSQVSSKDNDKLFEQLNLTPSQIRKVQAISEKFEPEILSRRRAIVMAKNELQSLKENNGSSSQIKGKEQEIKNLKRDLAAVRKRYAAEMQAVLTPQQWSKLQKLIKERQEE
jgi:Spy/CpxP family protein refolding chaperone